MNIYYVIYLVYVDWPDVFNLIRNSKYTKLNINTIEEISLAIYNTNYMIFEKVFNVMHGIW